MKYINSYNKHIESQITNDLLINEGFSDILDKLKSYGKKGLLTTAILLSLLGSASAANKQDEIIKIALENFDRKDKIEFYNAIIGLSTRYESESMKNNNLDAASAFKEISVHYTQLRDNRSANELSKNAKEHLKVIFESIKKYNDSEKSELIAYGSSIKRQVNEAKITKATSIINPKEWLNDRKIRNYVINEDDTVDVNGDVNIFGERLRKIPIKFGKVTGNFDCSENNLRTLEGCPSYVGGNFTAHSNKLKNLIGGPEEVDGNYNACINDLNSLNGCAAEIGKNLYIDGNEDLKRLDTTSNIKGDIHCYFTGVKKSNDGFLGHCEGRIIYYESDTQNLARIIR